MILHQNMKNYPEFYLVMHPESDLQIIVVYFGLYSQHPLNIFSWNHLGQGGLHVLVIKRAETKSVMSLTAVSLSLAWVTSEKDKLCLRKVRFFCGTNFHPTLKNSWLDISEIFLLVKEVQETQTHCIEKCYDKYT